MIESNEKDSIISIVKGIQPIDYQYSKLGRIMNGYFKKRLIKKFKFMNIMIYRLKKIKKKRIISLILTLEKLIHI